MPGTPHIGWLGSRPTRYADKRVGRHAVCALNEEPMCDLIAGRHQRQRFSGSAPHGVALAVRSEHRAVQHREQT